MGLFQTFEDAHRAARGTHVFSTASDGQWPARNLQLMMREMLESGADLVVGVRTNKSEIYGRWRRFVSRCFELLPRLLFGIRVNDAGSIKLGRCEIFQLPLVSRSPFIEAERIIRAVRQGFKVSFVPIEFLPRGKGRAHGGKFSYVAKSFVDSLRCLWRYRVCGSI
jgi:hypothetical protein